MAIIENRTAIAASIAAFLFCLGGTPAVAADATGISTLDTKAIEKIIRDYLLKNPKIVNDAMEAHHRNVAEQEEIALRQAIKEKRQEIRHDPDSVVAGNVAGDVTLVEFFDYRCGVCKRVHSIIEEVVKRDGKVRLVYKEWPILGPQSVLASRAAIAARKQGDDKYVDFHNKMMTARQSLSPGSIMKLAESAGLDQTRLQRDMKDPEIDKILRRNYDLAQALKLNGTPSFLIDDVLLRGGRDADTMLDLVKEARKKS